MGKTRSMNRKKKHDFAYGMDRIKNWSDLHHDVLILVMMQLGGVDFLAFRGVCKSWRSLAVSNRNKFMVSRPPMAISVSIDADEDEYYLEDFEGRKFKISLPHFAAGMSCIGVTGGYLILINQKTYDCWLVNLIKRHELHFPNANFRVFCCPGFFRSTLVFSSSISEWVFVVSNIEQEEVWFCIAGKPEWTEISIPFNIVDFCGFKGKIYALIRLHEVRLYEMELFPKLKLVLLTPENFTTPDFGSPRFVNSGENLYLIDQVSKHPFKIHELDFGEVNLVSREKTIEKYAFFRDTFMDTITLREVWADIDSQYRKYVVHDEKGKGRLFYACMWYFFNDCLTI